MSTRGLYGFVLDGEEKLTFSKNASSPDGLGAGTLETLHELLESEDGFDYLCRRVKAIRLVDGNAPINLSKEDRKELKQNIKIINRAGYLKPHWSVPGIPMPKNDWPWKWFFRYFSSFFQANLQTGYMSDDHEFAQDTLWCEYGYVIDLDAKVFEVYAGSHFNDVPAAGRFYNRASEESEEDPLMLVASYPLDDLPTIEEYFSDMSEIFNLEYAA